MKPIDTTTLNIRFLTHLGVGKSVKDFIVLNNLEHFPVSRIGEIKGDHCGWIGWITGTLDDIQAFDRNGYATHYKGCFGVEYHHEYDKDGNVIRVKYSNGVECWKEYDQYGNEIYCKWSDSNIVECWHTYDESGNRVHSIDSNGVEYWREYDESGNMIHMKSSFGYESWREYDSNGNRTHIKDSTGFEEWYKPTTPDVIEIEHYPSGQLKRYGDMILPDLSISSNKVRKTF